MTCKLPPTPLSQVEYVLIYIETSNDNLLTGPYMASKMLQYLRLEVR